VIKKEAKKECKESSDMVQGTDKEKDLYKGMDSSISTKQNERDGAAAYTQTFLSMLAASMVRKGCCVLVSAGMELIFFSVAAVFGFSTRRMLIMLMYSIVAKKSRTSSSFSYSANEPVCRSWGKQRKAGGPGWPVEIFHTVAVTVYKWELASGAGTSLSLFHEFKSSLVQQFGLLGEFCKICTF